jgi:hypothetical protein
MAWYWIVLIIIGAIVLIGTVSGRIGENKAQKKYEEFIADISTWKVGDELKTSKHYMEQARKNGLKYPKLVKWDDKEVLIDVGDGMVTLVGHGSIHENRDDFWRMKHASMNKFMREINKLTEYKPQKDKDGKEIESKMDVKQDENGNITIDGQPLEGMGEVYLQIYLKYAIEEKRNRLAEAIRKELHKWR